jgi:hypothetical protein
MFVPQVGPVKPTGQVQVNAATPLFTTLAQTPPFWHGAESQTSGNSQCVPQNADVQTHVYAFNRSVQVPPFWHCTAAQSSTLASHVRPVQPVAQAQLKAFT